MPDIYDQIGAFNGTVEIVAIRECCGAQKQGVEAANDAFAQLGIEKGNAGFVEEVRHGFPDALAVGARAQEE